MEADEGCPLLDLPIELLSIVTHYVAPSVVSEQAEIEGDVTEKDPVAILEGLRFLFHLARTCKLLWETLSPSLWQNLYHLKFGDVLDIWNLAEIPLHEVECIFL